ncbi:MAG TPA: PAS domain S-box protein [Patescibacteria group bacterium]|nr:PAS domain S-box protein [Patescibacteria group bacterium]
MAQRVSKDLAAPRPAFPGRRMSAVALVGGYALVGAAWILLSDSLLRILLPGRPGELVASVKGVGFIVVTAIALWGVLMARDHLLARTERERAAAVEATTAIFRSSPLAIVAADRDGRITAWSPAAERLLGWREEEVVGRPATILRPDDPAWVSLTFGEVIAGATLVAVPVGYPHRDGRSLTLELSAAPLRDETGGVRGVLVVAEDVTEVLEAQADRARLETAIGQAAEAIVVTDPTGAIVYVNPAFERVTGYPRAELLGRNPRILKSGVQDEKFYARLWATLVSGSTWRGTLVNRRKDGTLFEEETSISPVRDPAGRTTAYVAVKRDVSVERALAADLRAELADRAAVREAIGAIRGGPGPQQTAGSVVSALLALDGVSHAAVFHLSASGGAVATLATALPSGFPTVVGQPLAPRRARYLTERAGEGPWVREYGRDPAVDAEFDAARRAAGITAAAYAPVMHDGRAIALVGCYATRPDGAERLGRRLGALLEVAAHAAPLLGPQLAAWEGLVGRRSSVEAVIRRRQFHPVFQPIVRLAEERSVIGYEALTRFDDGVAPDVRFAEAAVVGCGVYLETACLRAAVAAGSGLPAGAWLALNVSEAFVLSGRLRAILRGVDRPVVIELTEYVAVTDYVALRSAVDRLGPGVWLAVDDAGAGFAGLRHVVELRPHVVKLDGGIIRGIEGDAARQSLVAGMVHYASLTGTHLVAEGVETAEERRVLAALGVELAQGYLFARPAPLAELAEEWRAA